jgi:hypothetical protein
MIPKIQISTARSLLAAGSFAAVLGFSSLAQAQTPLLQYNFNEGTGTTIANSGTLGSAANLNIGGAFGGIIEWNSDTITGTGSAIRNITGATRSAQPGYISGNGTTLNTNLSQFTLTMWVNLSAVSAGDRLFSFFSGAAGFELQAGTVAGENTTLSLLVDAGTVASSASTDVVGQWSFIAVTYDGTATTNNVSFYSGGDSIASSLLGTVRTLNQGALATVTGATTAIRVGNPSTTTTDRSPAGMFDDVAVYGGLLDASQIEAVRLASIPEPSTYALMASGAALLVASVIRRRRR